MEQARLIYEQPMNELMRICLRLEYLFIKINHYLPGHTDWHHHCVLDAILKITDILDRPDCKAKFVQQMQLYQIKLTQLQNTPQVDRATLDVILAQLTSLHQQLYAHPGKLADSLRCNDFLHGVQQQLRNPGGMCRCDAPAYHFWLRQSSQARVENLTHWLDELATLRQAVILLLRLTRESASSKMQTAQSGFYQDSFEQENTFQLVRIGLPNDATVYPELSIGRHRLVIRFIEHNVYQKALQTDNDVVFELICCTSLATG